MAQKSQTRKVRIDPEHYWQRSQRPLQSLFFLLPMILIYELALPLFGLDQMRRVLQDVYARRLLFEFFSWFGVGGHYLPALIVMAVLLAQHMVRKDPWRLDVKLYGLMYLESMVAALPLLIFLLVLLRRPSAAAGVRLDEVAWQAKLVFSIGAGIYEELLFRLIGIALLHMVFVDVLGLPRKFGAGLTIAATALIFAFYHFSEANPFSLAVFLQYTLAGVYFAVIYLLRGFGIVAGTHAMYDLFLVVLFG